MREDNLLCIRKRKFVVTTDSNHGRKVYPNLAAGMVLTGVDPTVAGRYHLCPAARRIRLSGGDFGRTSRAASSAGLWIATWKMS